MYKAIKRACDKKAGGDSGKKPALITAGIIGTAVLVLAGIGGALGETETNQPETTTEASAVFAEITSTEAEQTEQLTEEETTEAPTTEAVTEAKTEKPTEKATEKVTEPKKESRTVYRTKSGEKYHYENPYGSGEYYPISLDEAIEKGYEPCEKCVLN